MCTLSWFRRPGGFDLFFNRDERRTRKAALPPELRRSGSTSFLAPTDGDHGGTWLAVNAAGVGICLLNGFPAAGSPVVERSEYTSRGEIPLSLVESVRAAAAAERLAGLELSRFRPFVLVVIDSDGGGLTARWSGEALDVERRPPPEGPLVSSSFFTEEVRRSRVAVFRRMEEAGSAGERRALHLAFHASHAPRRGPHSPCMHRPDARTVSFSWIRVDAREVALRYVADSPCRGVATSTALRLPRGAGVR